VQAAKKLRGFNVTHQTFKIQCGSVLLPKTAAPAGLYLLLMTVYLQAKTQTTSPASRYRRRAGDGGMGVCVFLVLSYARLVVRQRFFRTHSRLRLIPRLASSLVKSRKDSFGLE
jgi:hypothetical protein